MIARGPLFFGEGKSGLVPYFRIPIPQNIQSFRLIFPEWKSYSYSDPTKGVGFCLINQWVADESWFAIPNQPIKEEVYSEDIWKIPSHRPTNQASIAVELHLDLPFVCNICAKIHPKNLPKGKHFTYLEDPGIPRMVLNCDNGDLWEVSSRTRWALHQKKMLFFLHPILRTTLVA